MGIIASDMRRGMAIMFNGEPCRVLEFHHHTPGNLRAMVQAKLRRLKTGIQIEHRFRSTDTVEVAALETHELDFMYKAGTTYHFMNAENYDQIEVDEETLGSSAKWMAEGMRIIAEWYDGRPIGIQLPSALTLEVVDTTPVMKTAFFPKRSARGFETMMPRICTTLPITKNKLRPTAAAFEPSGRTTRPSESSIMPQPVTGPVLALSPKRPRKAMIVGWSR